MQQSKLFEYAVLYHPRSKKDVVGGGELTVDVKAKSQLLVGVKTVLALSDKEVAMLAAREIPADYLDKLEQVEIVIRPFA